MGGGTLTGPAAGWRREAIVSLVTFLLMLWPLAINGAPFYSADSASYLRGGAFGFNTGLLILEHWWQSLFAATNAASGGDPNAIVTKAIADSGGARSLIYSLLTYVLRFPGVTLLALAAAQAGAVVLVLSCLRRLMARGAATRPAIAVGAAVALLTSAPWYAAYAMPDILAGVTIAGSVALTILFDRTSLAMRAALVLVLVLCITTHGSHLLIAFSTLVAGGVIHLWMHHGFLADSLRKALWFVSPIVLAVAALLATSYAAFGEPSLAPKRYPIQLARSVADGPGAWYLRDHCATERYAICEVFGPNPPRDVGDFLWGPNGVRYRATPEQMERIRAEESTIVRSAALAYPGVQLRHSATNTVAQLFEFGLFGLRFGQAMVAGDDPTIVESGPDKPELRAASEVIIYLSFFASILLLAALRRQLTSAEIAAVSVAAIGLLANATVCGTLSGVTDRYQGRVVWVLPALALIIALRMWNERRPLAGPS